MMTKDLTLCGIRKLFFFVLPLSLLKRTSLTFFVIIYSFADVQIQDCITSMPVVVFSHLSYCICSHSSALHGVVATHLYGENQGS